MSSLDVLVTTLVKAFKLEPEVDKARELFRKAIADDLPGQAREAIALIRGFDERLSRIERHLGIEAGTDPENFERTDNISRLRIDDTTRLRNGTD